MTTITIVLWIIFLVALMLIAAGFLIWVPPPKPQEPCPCRGKLAVSFAMSFSKDVDHLTYTIKGTPLMDMINKGDKLIATVTPIDADGNPTVFDGTVSWESSDPTAVSVEASVDGLSATCTALRANASATVTASGDGAQGDAVLKLTASGVVSVRPTDAATVAMVFTPAPAATPEVAPVSTP